MKFLLSLILSFLLSLMSISHAKSHKQQKIIISDAWSRASPGKTGVVYLTIFNHDTTLDRLLSATTSIANSSELHTHLYEDDVMKMRLIPDIEVNSMERAVLEPGGKHIMLFGLKAPLKEGEYFLITLLFERLGKVDVKVKIRKLGAMYFNDSDKIIKDEKHKHLK